MTDRGTRVDVIFEKLVDLSSEERLELLARECGDDSDVRDAVEARLRAFDRVGKDTEFLEPAVNFGHLDQAGIKIRCPHCDNPVEILDDEDSEACCCSNCGSHFNILSSREDQQEQSMPKTLGRFHLVDKLGDGAFGSVWRATDPELDRDVAIKIPRRNQLQRQDEESFLREARVAARLRHANIVAVHEIGREGEMLYIVSDLIDGDELSKWMSAHKPNTREAVEMCIKIATGLHHAHEAGVIHRDLKPSNILVSANGEPHITDFGLAKHEAGEITMTIDGQILGTPAYMSPEQAKGESRLADRRCDVYSLGVVLYEMLTGRLPFAGDTPMLIQKVVDAEVPPLRRFDPAIPKDLETICLKCLEKDPAGRYATADDLAEDLERFLDFQPIKAKRINLVQRTSRWLRRHQKAVSINSVIGIVAIVMTVVGLRLWRIHEESQFAKLTFTGGQGTSTATILSDDGEVVKRLAVPSLEDVSIRGGTYQMIIASELGWHRNCQINVTRGRHHRFTIESSWPQVWDRIPSSKAVDIIDRVGVLGHDARAKKLFLIDGESGQPIWERSLTDFKAEDSRNSVRLPSNSSLTKGRLAKSFPIGDVNHDGKTDILVRLIDNARQGMLVVFSGANGDTIWERRGLTIDVPPLLVAGMAAQPDRILVQSGNITRGIDTRTGGDLWEFEHRGRNSYPSSNQESVAPPLARLGQVATTVITAGNQMFVLNAITGEVMKSIAGEFDGGVSAILNGPEDHALVILRTNRLFANRQLVAKSLPSLETRWQINEATVLEQLSTPASTIGIEWTRGPDTDDDGYGDLYGFVSQVVHTKKDYARYQELRQIPPLPAEAREEATLERRDIIARAKRRNSVHVYSGRTGELLSSHEIDPFNDVATSIRYLEGSYNFLVSNTSYHYLITPGKKNAKWTWHTRLPRSAGVHHLDADGIYDFVIRGPGNTGKQVLTSLGGSLGQTWRIIEPSGDLTLDITGDGMADLVTLDDSESLEASSESNELASSIRSTRSESIRPSRIRLISGANGRVLWTSVPLRIGFWRACRDLDGDGLVDLIVGTRDDDTPDDFVDTLRAMSSSDGQQIWFSRLFVGQSKQGHSQFGRAELRIPGSSTDGFRHFNVIENATRQPDDDLIICSRMATLSERGRIRQHHWMLASLSAATGSTNWKHISSPFAESVRHHVGPASLDIRALEHDRLQAVLGLDHYSGFLGIHDLNSGKELWSGKMTAKTERDSFHAPRRRAPRMQSIADRVVLAFNSASLTREPRSSSTTSEPELAPDAPAETTALRSSEPTSLFELQFTPNTVVLKSHILRSSVSADRRSTTVSLYRRPQELSFDDKFELGTLDTVWQRTLDEEVALLDASDRDGDLRFLVATGESLKTMVHRGDDGLHDLWSWRVAETEDTDTGAWIAAKLLDRRQPLWVVARDKDLAVLDLDGQEPVELGRTRFDLATRYGIWVLYGVDRQMLVLKTDNLFRGIDMANFSQLWDWTSPVDVRSARTVLIDESEGLIVLTGGRSYETLLADTGIVKKQSIEMKTVHIDRVVGQGESRLMWTSKEVHFVEAEQDRAKWSWTLPARRIQFKSVIASKGEKPDLLLFEQASAPRNLYLLDSSNGQLLWTGSVDRPSRKTNYTLTQANGSIELRYADSGGQKGGDSTPRPGKLFRTSDPGGVLLGLACHEPEPIAVFCRKNEYFSQIFRPMAP